MNRWMLLGSAWICLVGVARGEFPAPESTSKAQLFPSVRLTTATYRQPRPLRVWVVAIDLTSPDVDFVVTPRTRIEKFETTSQTAVEFAKEHTTQIAINATPFGPIRTKAGDGVDVSGLHLVDGQVVSPPVPNYGALLLDPMHRARILSPPISDADLKSATQGVGGFTVVLAAHKNLALSEKDNPKAALHPRTAVGLSADTKTMYWLIIDGRQRRVSEGVNLFELAEIGRSAGCADLLNLDGGGSSTLVIQKSNDWNVVNTPVGRGNMPGTLRFNGNHLGIRIFESPRDLTFAQLRAIMPNLSEDKARTFIGPLNRAMSRSHINNPLRRAAFLGQLAHESGELRYMEEIASGEAYEGRKELGNTQPGDGKRYKGRGPIQLTGRFNYRQAGAALSYDLENYPEIAAQPIIGCQVAGWYWDSRKLNELADSKNYREITKRINGGYHGMAQREKYYQTALKVLNVK